LIVSSGNFVANPTGPSQFRLPYDELGSITPMAAFGSYYGGGSVNLSGLQASYAAIYKAQLWAFVLIKKRSTALARLPFRAYLKTADGSREPAASSQFGELMSNPNDMHDPVFFWTWTQSTFDIYGEAIWAKIRDPRGRVRSLWPMHPTNTVTFRGEDGRWKYIFTTGARNVPLLPEFDQADVVHFRSYNPENTERGMSPMEPLRQTLLAEDAARRAQSAMWQNGARPSVALTTPNKLSDTAYNRLVATWDNKHSGVDNWAKTAILEEGLVPKPLSLSAEEMQYIASRQLNREEVCAAYDMPPPAVHILDHATYSNITEQNRSLYRDTMAGVVTPLEAAVNSQLVPDFKSDGDIYGRFDMDDVLRGNFEQQTAAFAQAIGTGQMTPQEARRRMSLPDLDGADQLLVNAALIPLRVIETVSVGTGADVNLVPQRVKSLTTNQARAVQGRVSRAKAVDDIDASTLVADLGEAADTVLGLLNAAKVRGADIGTFRQWINASIDDMGEPKELTA
jgi:HK97 family phage portal protein